MHAYLSFQVVFADGTFVDGSTLELSADGPLREPYIVYSQVTHMGHMLQPLRLCRSTSKSCCCPHVPRACRGARTGPTGRWSWRRRLSTWAWRHRPKHNPKEKVVGIDRQRSRILSKRGQAGQFVYLVLSREGCTSSAMLHTRGGGVKCVLTWS